MNRYERKRLSQVKMKKLYDKGVYFVSDRSNKKGKVYYKRFYLSGMRKFCKKETNRKYRKSKELLQGCAYRRLYDYWWTLF